MRVSFSIKSESFGLRNRQPARAVFAQSPVFNNFRSVVMKRNSLTTAILAGLTGVAGMAGVANAVNLNPDGLGQVLLYPYYTAREGNDTLISVVNTTDSVKAVKVRFIEALNSREVLDFNLYLSPYDVWTSAVTDLGGGVPGMRTTDTSCTVPYFQGGTPGNVGEQEFLNYQYAGGNWDGVTEDIERAASGYIEIIEMGTVVDSTLAAAATHSSAGTPAVLAAGTGPCHFITAAWQGGDWDNSPDFGIEGATGGLFGSGTIVNVDEGTMISYNATAIDGFWSSGDSNHTDPGNILPNLGSGDEESYVFNNGVLDNQFWNEGIQAVDAVLSHDFIFNEYVVDEDRNAASEWVVAFPTKSSHVDTGVGGQNEGANTPLAPFTDTWAVNPNTGAALPACEAFDFDFWDREEQRVESGIIVSPPPPTARFELCREVNVIRFAHTGAIDNSEILKEVQRSGNLGYTNFKLPSQFSEGWVRFNLGKDDKTGSSRWSEPSTSEVQYLGLPVIGFWANTVQNGALGAGVLSNYGSAYDHRGSRHFE